MIPGWSTYTSSTYVICYLALTIAPIIAPIVNTEPKTEYCSITKRCSENHIQKCIRQEKDSLWSNATKWILHKAIRYNISLHFESWNSDFYMNQISISKSYSPYYQNPPKHNKFCLCVCVRAQLIWIIQYLIIQKPGHNCNFILVDTKCQSQQTYSHTITSTLYSKWPTSESISLPLLDTQNIYI